MAEQVEVAVAASVKTDIAQPAAEDETSPVGADNWGRPFFRSVFCGYDGRGSMARVVVFMIVFAAILWVSWIVRRKCELPPFGGLSLFVLTVIAAVYVPSKVAGMVASKQQG